MKTPFAVGVNDVRRHWCLVGFSDVRHGHVSPWQRLAAGDVHGDRTFQHDPLYRIRSQVG